MVEPTDSVSASTSTSSQYEAYQNLLSNQYEGSDFSQGSTMYQLEMADAMESMMDLTNQVCLPQLKIETNRDVISRVLGAQISCSLALPNAL